MSLLEVRIVLAGPESPADADDEAADRSEERERRREERQLRREERRRDLAGPEAPAESDILDADEEDVVETDNENADDEGPLDGTRPQVERSQRDADIVSVVDPQAFQEPLPAAPPEITTPVENTLPAPPVEVLGFIGGLPVRDESPADGNSPPAPPVPEPPAPPEPLPSAPPVEVPPGAVLPGAVEILSSIPGVAQVPEFVADRLPTLPRSMPAVLLPLPGPLGAMPVEVSGLLDDLFEVFFDWFANPEPN